MTNPIRIIGVPIDLGAQHRGTDMGPSALRVAGGAAGLRKLGREVTSPGNASKTTHPNTTGFRHKPLIVSLLCEM